MKGDWPAAETASKVVLHFVFTVLRQSWLPPVLDSRDLSPAGDTSCQADSIVLFPPRCKTTSVPVCVAYAADSGGGVLS